MRNIIAALIFMFFLMPGLSWAQEDTAPKAPIFVLTMKGAVGPAYDSYLRKGLAKAREEKAQLVLLELNTPGGLLSSTRDMVSVIVESDIPVAVWVTPSGAHAASAGTFLMYAAHINAMDSGTNIGAATPIEMSGGDEEAHDEGEDGKDISSGASLRRKSIEDTAAFIRGLADMRGRNAAWAEDAVTNAKSLTSDEALRENVIDYIADSREALLFKISGKEITTKDGNSRTLQTAGAPVREFPPDWKTLFLALITDPNVAIILMSIGFYGLVLEFYHPGTLIPGTIGTICLILGLYAMNVLPVNAAGLALLVIGMAFMIAESFIPSFGVMGFGGVAAFLVGAAIMFDTSHMPGMELQWNIIAGIGLCGLLIVALTVFLTVRAYRHKVSTGTESMVGDDGQITEWKGDHGRVRVQGEEWRAVSDHKLDLKKGDRVFIESVNDLTVKIRATE